MTVEQGLGLITGDNVKLIGIAIRDKNQAPMQTLEMAEITETDGIVGDFRRRPGKRQITVMSHNQWNEACKDVETQLPWTTRRANLLIDGCDFSANMIGMVITIGDSKLKIMDETEPCHKMDQQLDGLRGALTPDWRGGVCCKVISGGAIKIGDNASIK